ncbi:PREDICTED: pacifastin-like protease inhibitor cvp4 [Ceratosolen solmsi marchali]|uniref:Pacifastin-like protease inhibitor cvp4 n=1 Tax=Ceratosolen solmsi marchali TaxID=326594 RepID=A0AAJ6YKJ7_9HYME|nr:PREDICTED: pacifastin-like protease inhibitor cvp4 [Ceratosolen solmsi marchali]
MTGFSIIDNLNKLIFLAIVNSAFAIVPGRDDWYLAPYTYDDVPRLFELNIGCPYERFYLDCNECICHSNDAEPRCTLRSCPEIPQIVNWGDGQRCPAGRPFYWKCNDCFCGPSGREALCTRKYCPNYATGE